MASSMITTLLPIFCGLCTAVSYYGGVFTDKIGSYKILIISFIFGILSILTLKLSIWLSILFLAFFTILSLNSIRSYISLNAQSKGFVFGIFYGGVAIFSSLGALTIGHLWQNYGVDSVLKFSLGGIILITILMLLKSKRLIVNVGDAKTL